MARAKKGQGKTDARLRVEQKVASYLSKKHMEFESTKAPNLPANKEGGINVSVLCKEAGLSPSDKNNHVYKDPDIVHEINRHAVAQGISPIDSSSFKKVLNAETSRMVSMSAKRAKESQDQLVELQSTNEHLLMENARLKAEIESLKSQQDAFFESGQLPYFYGDES